MPYFDDVILTLTPESGTPPGTDFSCDALGALLEPDVEEETRKYLCGPRTYSSTPTWKLTLDFDQNWDADGLSAWLQAHSGELGTVVIQSSTLAHQATATVRIKPGPFGGTAGEIAEGSVELTVDDQPTFAPYTPAGALAAGELENDDDHQDDDLADAS
jgi:hypothetical protein